MRWRGRRIVLNVPPDRSIRPPDRFGGEPTAVAVEDPLLELGIRRSTDVEVSYGFLDADAQAVHDEAVQMPLGR